VLQDLGTTLRELLDHGPRHATDVGDTVRDRFPLQAQTVAQLASQDRLVQVSRRLSLTIEVAGIERCPAAVRALREVARYNVRVEQRIARARRAVKERGGDEPAPADLDRAPGTAPGTTSLTLQIVQCLAHRRVMPGAQFAGDVGRTDRPQHAH
jgi:hypothetical protein